MKKFDAYIFDFDGTLADSMWVWEDVDRRFLARRDIPFSRDFVEGVSVLGFEAGADWVVDYFGLDEKPEDIIEEWKELAVDGYANHVRLKPRAEEYLRAIHELGYPMGIATSLQRHLLEPCLRNNGILDLFKEICICDELQCNGKSTPIVYQETAKGLGVDVERCIIFEDVNVAAVSAKKTGAFVVGIYDEHKQQKTNDLKQTVDRFVLSYDELCSEIPTLPSAK